MRRLVAVVPLALLMATLTGAGFPRAAAQKGDAAQPRTLTGRVLTRENQPLAKAVVYLKNSKTLLIRSYITDADGAYRFTALAPGVDYEVYAGYQGGRSDTKTLSAFDSRRQVNITLRIRASR